jgi:hypothetical protein
VISYVDPRKTADWRQIRSISREIATRKSQKTLEFLRQPSEYTAILAVLVAV